jgi:hypothetical protein
MWFHFLLSTVPGWWNKYGKADSEQVFGNMLTLAYATEIDSRVASSGDTILLNGLAEAFARKAWASEVGFYHYVGSRHALYNRMVDILWQGHTWNDDRSRWSGGVFTPKGIKARFISMMDQEMRLRFTLLSKYGQSILTNRTWHSANEDRPWDWGNLKSYNPKWFKAWINWNAPMLADPRGRAIPSDKTQAIWYAWPRSRNAPKTFAQWTANDTEYIMTKAQQERGLCGQYSHGCVEMPSNAERPKYIPDFP